MTINDLLKIATKKLSHSTSPELDAEVLLSHVLDEPKEFLLQHPEYKPTPKQEKQFKILLERKSSGEPVAYITKNKAFLGRDFYVDRNVLVPRPETEGLVELVIDYSQDKNKLSILDVGTGSGCIIISLAKNLRGKFFASDISAAALKVAKRNAKTHQAKITFKQGSLLKPWSKRHFDIIVANLPYLAKEVDPSTKFEPKKALIAPKNGLGLLEDLLEQILPLNPLPAMLFLEIDPSQDQKLKKLAAKLLPEFKFKAKKDLSDLTRYVTLSKLS